MAKGERFEDLVVWRKGMTLVGDVYRVTRQGELSKDFPLRDQLRRAAISIPANIAEGYERSTRPQYLNFLQIAKGSAGELRCLITLARDLEFMKKEEALSQLKSVEELSRLLAHLIQSLQPPPVD